MECTFQVGDRVVCVDVSARPGYTLDGLVEGEIYTISGIRPWISPGSPLCRPGESIIGVDLAEIVRSDPYMPYNSRRFRPVKPLSFWLGEKQEILDSVTMFGDCT